MRIGIIEAPKLAFVECRLNQSSCNFPLIAIKAQNSLSNERLENIKSELPNSPILRTTVYILKIPRRNREYPGGAEGFRLEGMAVDVKLLFESTIALTTTVRLVYLHENVKAEKMTLARDRARRSIFVMSDLLRAMSLKPSMMMDLIDE